MRFGISTVFAIFAPRHRGKDGLGFRRQVFGVVSSQSLARHVDWQISIPLRPWPAGLSPTKRKLKAPRSGVAVPRITVGYPEGDEDLAALALVVRDRLRPSSGESNRAVPFSKQRVIINN